MPHGQAFVSALFSVYGDMATEPAPSPTSSSSTAAAAGPPTPPPPPPLPIARQTVRAPLLAQATVPPPSPPSSTSPSSPPDTDSSQYIFIDLTTDDDDDVDTTASASAADDTDRYVDIKKVKEEEAEKEDDTAPTLSEWTEEESGMSEEVAQRLEQERAVAEREWREGPLAAALREVALTAPSTRPRAPDLLYDMRRFEEREAFRDTLQVSRRSRRVARRNRSLPSASTSTSTSASTSILDSIVEERLLRSPPPDLRRHTGRRPYHEPADEEPEEAEEPEAANGEVDEEAEPTSGGDTFGLERLFWVSLAKCESRKRVHDYNYVNRLEAIDRSHAALENTQSAFERAFVKLRIKEKRRRLKKARAKWLAEDRRPFTPEEQALVSRVLRGRATEVLVTGFNTELTRQDLQRLRDTEWLNDEVINFYLSLLKQRSDDLLKRKSANAKAASDAGEEEWPRVHFLNTFFYPLLSDKGGYNYSRVQKWTRRVDIFSLDRVVVPIHLGNHWCLAVINLQDRRFEYYDSLGSSNRECLQRLRRYLQDEARDKKKIELDLSEWDDHQPKDIPMQKNGYDCGVFACKFAECIASGRPFYFSQVDMPTYRKRMMVSILNKTLA